MKLSFSMLASLLFLLTLIGVQTAEAGGFANTGRMQSKTLTLTVGGTLDNNGELIGTESATISCDTLSGKGLIHSPQISIKTKIFAFTGTIECSGKCTIITGSSFNKKMFKRRGGGEFVIIIDKTQFNNNDHLATIGFTEESHVTDELLFDVK